MSRPRKSLGRGAMGKIYRPGANQGVPPPWFQEHRALIDDWNDRLDAEDLTAIGACDAEALRAQSAHQRLADARGQLMAEWTYREIWRRRSDRIRWALLVEGWTIPDMQETCMRSKGAPATDSWRMQEVKHRMMAAHEAERREGRASGVELSPCWQHDAFKIECASCVAANPEHAEALAHAL